MSGLPDASPEREGSGNRRAIVIGGGIAGLLAGRVLADHFDEVVVLERDDYPVGPDPRAGAPQAKHVHLLLLRGKRILERLFPGLNAELVDNGAAVVRMGKELAVLTYHGWRARYPGKLTLLTFTRPLLEACIRRRVTGIEAVTTVEECRVTGLLDGGGERNRVTGVRCRLANDPAGERRLYGELVIDASGRFSRAPAWLSALGYDCPEETVVDPLLGYASRLFQMPAAAWTPPGFRGEWKALLLLGKPPDHTRGGVLLPVERSRWHVTLVGVGEDFPPTDEAGFLDFARSLRSNTLYETIKDVRPLSKISGYRATDNRRRHYERLRPWPTGFIVLGDALSAFNPVYAQGITVAALEAMVLDECLGDHRGNWKGMTRKFQREVTKVIETPWLLATTEDVRWSATRGGPSGPSTRWLHRYLDAVMALATEYPEVDRRFARVAHLVEPAYTLFHPRIALRALFRSGKGPPP